MAEYDIDNIYSLNVEVDNTLNECQHEDYYIEKGERICGKCSKILEYISFDKDWRFYGSSDNRTSKDPARCHRRKDTAPSLAGVLGKTNYHKTIKDNAELKYQKIIRHLSEREGKTQIYRGGNRKAIAAVCIYYAFMDEGHCVSLEDLIKDFHVQKKKLTGSMKIFKDVFPSYIEKYVEPHNLIRPHLFNIGLHNKEDHEKIIELCKSFYNRSELMNSSYPRSIAAAVVYFYITTRMKSPMNMKLGEYAKLVGLSEATISNLVKNIQLIPAK